MSSSITVQSYRCRPDVDRGRRWAAWSNAELSSTEEEEAKAPRQDVWPKVSAGTRRHPACRWHRRSYQDSVDWTNHRGRCTCTEERCQICLLTLLAPWLTLDYKDSCIFSCGGWHYFSSVCFTEAVSLVPRHITLTRLFGWHWCVKAFITTRTELCKRWFGYTSRSSCLFWADHPGHSTHWSEHFLARAPLCKKFTYSKEEAAENVLHCSSGVMVLWLVLSCINWFSLWKSCLFLLLTVNEGSVIVECRKVCRLLVEGQEAWCPW